VAASPDDVFSMIVFARVVQASSFTAAAAKLGVSKSVVSARVAALEEHLGARLLHRTTRKLRLTPEGQALVAHCAPLLAAADRAADALATTGDRPRGLLRVNAPVVFAQDYLAEPVAAYLAQFPDVRVEITLNDRMVDLVDEGVDVALRVSSRLEGGGLTARRLASDRTVLVASPSYLARKGAPAAALDLAQHDCIVYSLLKASDEWRFREGKSIVTASIEGRFSAGSGALLRSAALAGAGLAVLPTFMVAGDLAAGRLRAVMESSFVGAALGIYAVYSQAPQARRAPPKVRAFVDLLVSHFRTPRW
jgi:DNA-binding transcriptional LysR family regulator